MGVTGVDGELASRDRRAVVMIRPVNFRSNPQTAASNAFQHLQGAPEADDAQAAALAEFQGLVSALRSADVEVIVFDDTHQPLTPDSVFPNNWFSTHEDGTVVLYPMEAENRRPERRHDIIDALSHHRFGYRVSRVLDLSEHEHQGRYLEGTGSLVLDRRARVAYACLSSRTDRDLAERFAEELGYSLELFTAEDREGRAIYHTNVMMCVGETFAVVCPDAIVADTERRSVLARLERDGHEVVTISHAQMESFAGNMLELHDFTGRSVLAMSAAAEACLEPGQRRILERHARIVSAPIPTIEACAGGSVRCMLAEIVLPPEEAEEVEGAHE